MHPEEQDIPKNLPEDIELFTDNSWLKTSINSNELYINSMILISQDDFFLYVDFFLFVLYLNWA